MSICKDLKGVDAVKSRFLSIGSAHLDGDKQNALSWDLHLMFGQGRLSGGGRVGLGYWGG